MSTHHLRSGTEKHNSTKSPFTTPPLTLPKPHLPFLIVSRPSNGPKTGSTDSSRFSIKTSSPAARARSIVSKYLWETALVPAAARLVLLLGSGEEVRGTEGVLHTAMAATGMCQQLRGRKRGKMMSTFGAGSGTGSLGCPTENRVLDLPRASNKNGVIFFPEIRAWAAVTERGQLGITSSNHFVTPRTHWGS